MKKAIFSFVFIQFFAAAIAMSAYARVLDVKCKDKTGKVRISIKCDNDKSTQVPDCLTEMKLDGKKASFTVDQFPDDGPILVAKNSAGQQYSAQFKTDMKDLFWGYQTEGVVQNSKTSLRCKPAI